MDGRNNSKRLSKVSQSRSYKISNKRSLNSDSIGEERKLFEDLGKIGDEEDMLLYQDDFKKFDTSRGFNTSVSISNLNKDHRNSSFLKRGFSRLETLKEKFKNRPLIKFNKFRVDTIFNKRRLCRVLTMLCILFSILATMITMFIAGFYKNTINISNENSILLEMDNCRLFLTECTDCKDTTVSIEHREGIVDLFSDISKKHES
jgi:hypothetical protein